MLVIANFVTLASASASLSSFIPSSPLHRSDAFPKKSANTIHQRYGMSRKNFISPYLCNDALCNHNHQRKETLIYSIDGDAGGIEIVDRNNYNKTSEGFEDYVSMGNDNNNQGSDTTGVATEEKEEIVADNDEWAALKNTVGRPMQLLEGEGTTASVCSSTSEKPRRHEEEETPAVVEAPTVMGIIKFAIPAVGIWLCSPLLSLIDTSAVGLLSGTVQQAALNPAVSVTDYGGLLVAFMYTATTNLVAAAQGIDSNHNKNGNSSGKSQRTAKTFVTSLQLGLVVGLCFGSIVALFGGALLRTLMGSENLDPAVFNAALRYVRIRSIGMPAAVVIGSAQSACLGMQDVRSPLYVLVAAALVNLVGDILFVGNKSPWIGGAAGAAWATTISQYAALALFLKWLKYKPRAALLQNTDTTTVSEEADQQLNDSVNVNAINDSNLIDSKFEFSTVSRNGADGRSLFSSHRKVIPNRINGLWSPSSAKYLKSTTSTAFTSLQKLRFSLQRSPKAGVNTMKDTRKTSPNSSSMKSRGFLQGHFKTSDLFKWSKINKSIANEFKPFVIPVTISSVGRISGYIAMSHVASSALGTTDMAAQQIVFSFFCCLTPLVDALSQTAQSFVPTIFEKEKSLRRTKALKQAYNSFFKAGSIFGSFILGLITFIPFLSRFFTTDPFVIAKVQGAIPGLMTFFAVGGLMCVGEGMLLGQKDLRFLGRMYGAYFFIVPYIMLRLKKRALLGIQDVGIGTMWGIFSIYQCIRVAIWHVRLILLQKRTERETLSFKENSSLR